LQPWLFVLASAAVVVVLYSREFHSRTLQALTGPAYADGHPAPIVKPLPGARSADGGF
jgi:uncharacterized membrane protein